MRHLRDASQSTAEGMKKGFITDSLLSLLSHVKNEKKRKIRYKKHAFGSMWLDGSLKVYLEVDGASWCRWCLIWLSRALHDAHEGLLTVFPKKFVKGLQSQRIYAELHNFVLWSDIDGVTFGDWKFLDALLKSTVTLRTFHWNWHHLSLGNKVPGLKRAKGFVIIIGRGSGHHRSSFRRVFVKNLTVEAKPVLIISNHNNDI